MTRTTMSFGTCVIAACLAAGGIAVWHTEPTWGQTDFRLTRELPAGEVGYEEEGADSTAMDGLAAGVPMGTTFTYQGRLTVSGVGVTGSYDFEFQLWDDDQGGQQVATPYPVTADVKDGRFTAYLDFGDVFTGEARWLRIGVCEAGLGSYYYLTPRQELTPAPYAMRAGLDCTTVTNNSCPTQDVCTASCPGGYQVTGGGFLVTDLSDHQDLHSHPVNGSEAWHCESYHTVSPVGWITIGACYAVCCR